MSDPMSFSMASMYGDYLFSSPEPEVEEEEEVEQEEHKGEDNLTHSIPQHKVSFQEEVKNNEGDEEEGEDLPPLRVESIYNMAFLQRPQTAIVTHGDEPGQQDSSLRIEEEEDSEVDTINGGGGGNADIWVADSEETYDKLEVDESVSRMNDMVSKPIARSSNSGANRHSELSISSKSKPKKNSSSINCCTRDLIW